MPSFDVARRHLCPPRRWLATSLRELVATLKRMLGGRPAGLNARIWLDAFFNDQRSPQVLAPLSRVGRFQNCTCTQTRAHAHVHTHARTHTHRHTRVHQLACNHNTAGDCEGAHAR